MTKEIELFVEWMTQMGFDFTGKQAIDHKKYYLKFNNKFFNMKCNMMPFKDEFVYFETFKEDEVFSGNMTDLKKYILDDLKIKYETVNLQYKDILDGNKKTISRKTKD